MHHDADRDAQRRLPPAVIAVIHVPEPDGGAIQIEHDGVEELGHLLRESLDAEVGQPAPLRHAGVNLAEPVSVFFFRYPRFRRTRKITPDGNRKERRKNETARDRGRGGGDISTSSEGPEVRLVLLFKRYRKYAGEQAGAGRTGRRKRLSICTSSIHRSQYRNAPESSTRAARSRRIECAA